MTMQPLVAEDTAEVAQSIQASFAEMTDFAGDGSS